MEIDIEDEVPVLVVEVFDALFVYDFGDDACCAINDVTSNFLFFSFWRIQMR